MSTNNQQEKVYVNAVFIKTVEIKDFSFLRMAIAVDDFIKFLEEHKNEGGFVTINLRPRKQLSEKGHSHYAELDTWKPKNETPAKPAQKKTKAAEPEKKSKASNEDPFGDESF